MFPDSILHSEVKFYSYISKQVSQSFVVYKKSFSPSHVLSNIYILLVISDVFYSIYYPVLFVCSFLACPCFYHLE